MRNSGTVLLSLLATGCMAGAHTQWFLPNDCSGADLTVSVVFDGDRIFDSRGPACDEYEGNLDGRWEKQMLSFEFEPDREITWEGYREQPFDSPVNSVLRVDLWLAGASRDPDAWIVGMSVRGADALYMNTIHIADLTGPSSSCIAENFCIRTWTD